MHRFTSHRGHTRRYFLNAHLPLNPICWLFGHKARGHVKEWRFNIAPSLFIRCLWCDRRYRNPDLDTRALKQGWDRAEAEAFEAQRVEVFRRDPRMVEESASGRVGYQEAVLRLSLEVVDRRHLLRDRGLARLLLDHAGFKLHLGDRSSETPWDGHVDVGVGAAFWSIGGVGGRLAEFLGRGQKRNLSLRLHGGQVWWELWHDDEGGNAEHAHRCDSWRQPTVWPWSLGRRKHRPWMCLRDGNLDLNPATAFWGTPSPTKTVLADDVTLPIALGEFPGDTYLIDGRLERWDWARDHGPAWARKPSSTWHYEWRGKIPTDRGNWKGDHILGSGVTLTQTEVEAGDSWQQLVMDRVVEQMLRDRRRNGYTPAVTS